MSETGNSIAAAVRGENPKVMARMRSGFAVIGDTQHLPGYSLLLTDDLDVDHPTDLPWASRRDFFFDLSLLGEAVFGATREQGAHRINYEVLRNSWPHLHGHFHPRYEWEPSDKTAGRPGDTRRKSGMLWSTPTTTRGTVSSGRRSPPS